MRIELDNAQATPSVTFIGNPTTGQKDIILAKFYPHEDGLLDVLENHFPKTDGIVLFDEERKN